MEVLQEIASHVKGRITVMADGGFRRGTDILKAKALGADAVLIGRAAIYGLAAGGEGGASHAIDILRSEIDRGLGLLGCPDIARLDAERLRLRRQHGVLSA
jgi:(S)-mandelate dehydrogenase